MNYIYIYMGDFIPLVLTKNQKVKGYIGMCRSTGMYRGLEGYPSLYWLSTFERSLWNSEHRALLQASVQQKL